MTIKPNSETEERETEVKLILKGELKRKLMVIKDHYCLANYTEACRLLIALEYDRISTSNT